MTACTPEQHHGLVATGRAGSRLFAQRRLQIVRIADPVLGIAAVGLPSARKPRAAARSPAIAKEKPLFEAPPIWLPPNAKP